VPSANWLDDATDYEIVLDRGGSYERLNPGMWVVAEAPSALPPNRSGLLRVANKYALVVLRALANWVIWDDRNGLPWPFATLASDTPTEAQKEALRDLVTHFGEDGGGFAWGEGIDLRLVESVSRGPSDGHSSLIAYAQQVISKLFLGGTLSNDAVGTTGTQAQATVHSLNTLVLIVAHALSLQAVIEEHAFARLLSINHMEAPTPQLRLQVLPELSPEVMAALFRMLQEMGVPCSLDQLRQMTGVRAPSSESDAVPLMGERR